MHPACHQTQTITKPLITTVLTTKGTAAQFGICIASGNCMFRFWDTQTAPNIA